MPQLWTIRRARPEDYDEIYPLEVLLVSLHHAARPDYFREPADCYPPAEYQALLACPGAIALVAEADGHPVGLCFGRVEDKAGNTVCRPRRIAMLEDLIVRPDWRGRGIAAALLECAKAEAVRLGACSLELCVWPFSGDALRLYEGLGLRTQYTRLELPLDAD